MRLPSWYGLVATGAGGGAICWWVRVSRFLTASTYEAGSSSDGEAQASPSRSGGKVGSLPVAIMEAEKPWGSWAMAFNANMMPGILSTHAREGTPASPEHVINGPVAPLVDGIPLRMVGRGE